MRGASGIGNSNSSTKTGARAPNSSLSVTLRPQRRYVRAVYGPKDRRYPKRDPTIEAIYPGHLLPSSPQMLEELLRRSLELELSIINARPLIAQRLAAGPASRLTDRPNFRRN
jgi:hypothetical protein